MPRPLLQGRSLALSAVLCGLAVHALSPSAAYAEAIVAVTLQDKAGQPAEGKVSLSGADGKSIGSCTTQAGHCEIKGVAGGTYTVTVEPVSGAAPKPRKVMIPPSGKVALVVASS